LNGESVCEWRYLERRVAKNDPSKIVFLYLVFES
jgi:hypothetical protein